MYEYFYNGGGVATGDFNGDGLTDLYFTANMSDNRCYLNTGGLKFKDITNECGAGGRSGPWKTGVSVIDINGDNKLDIYVSYSGMLPEPKRSNQFFINKGNDANGVPHFEDQAAAMGLASPGFSNQAYFFDCDLDGDLDMLLLNHNPKSLPVLNEIQNAEMIRQDDPLQGVRLFKQDKGLFTDATKVAGILGSALTYGLGIGIADMNRDGWPDFYVSNDYAVPDYLYINNKNGTFTDQIGQNMGHTSQFSMGNDVSDINNDGWPDVVTLDMLPEDNHRQKLLLGADNYEKFNLSVRSGFHEQFMRNMLQLNNGNGTFSEIGQMAGISNTDWSWAALLADYDNDGWKDLFITNGYLRDYTNLDFIHYMDNFVKAKGRMQREDVQELVKQMPASNVTNYIFNNLGGAAFANKTTDWGLSRPSNSNGAAYADLDNDGDLDLVVNNVNMPAFIWQNNAREQTAGHYLQVKLEGAGENVNGIGASVTVVAQGKRQTLENYPARGYLSTVSGVLHFGLGQSQTVDSLIVNWPGGKQQVLVNPAVDQRLTLKAGDANLVTNLKIAAKPLFESIISPVKYQQPQQNIRDFNRQNLLISEFSFTGPTMIKGDVDGDKREDILIGGAAGQGIVLYMQVANGSFEPKKVAAFETDKNCTDTGLALFDANGDGFADLYAASGGYHSLTITDSLLQDRLYLNDGKGNFKRDYQALPDTRASKGAVAVGDANGDGSPDLFVGGRVVPGRYPEAPRSFLLVNDGKGHFSDQTEAMAPELRNIGMVTSAVWVDLDQNGRPELAIAGEWMPVAVFGANGGKMENQTAKYFDKSYSGWWNTLHVADLNKDGKLDLIAGNLGRNSQVCASDKEPTELYFNDFDGNGQIDPIFCCYVQGKSYPYLTRDELGFQLPRMKAKFNNYKSYADATLADLFEPDVIQKASHLSANYLNTTVFLNKDGQPMSAIQLPEQAQYAPVYAIAADDFNGDGNPDLLLCGNNSHFKLRLGKSDANYGILLTGDGAGNFQYVPQINSGLQLKGDVRSVVSVGDRWIFGINQGAVTAYRRN